MQRTNNDGTTDHLLARFGAPLDEALLSDTVKNLRCLWDVKNARVRDDKMGTETLQYVSLSAFEDMVNSSWKAGGKNLNEDE